MTGFVSRLRNQLVNAVEGRTFSTWAAPRTWFESTSDCLTTIRKLAADEQVDCIEVTPPAEPAFFHNLQSASRAPQQRIELLTARYSHPLNITAPSEHRIREHLLERLMVADRARIESDSFHLLNAGDHLLKLNLIAIYSAVTTDLRYLDALNYYYELLPSAWYPDPAHNWLRISFLSFYVRALAGHITHAN